MSYLIGGALGITFACIFSPMFVVVFCGIGFMWVVLDI